MMHDECLNEIYKHLIPEARDVFAVLGEDTEGRSVEELMQAAHLSTHRVRVALAELRGATLVTRSVPVRLAPNGQQLWNLLRTVER